MQYRRLGRTRLDVSAIGFGAFPLVHMPLPETRVLVAGALAQGVKKDATALLTACGLALRSFD